MRKIITLGFALLLLCSLTMPALAAGSQPAASALETVEETISLDPRVERMIAWAVDTAADDTHGYSQSSRFGPNYDCSSFVCTAIMEGGFGLEDYILPSDMVEVLPSLGFEVYRKGETEPQRGDILVQPYVHVEICMGGLDCVSAHHDCDGRSGDSTGAEIEYRTAEGDSYCPFCQEEEYKYILRFNPLLNPLQLPVTQYAVEVEA